MVRNVISTLLVVAVISAAGAVVGLRVVASDVKNLEGRHDRHEEIAMHEGSRKLLVKLARVEVIVESLYHEKFGRPPPESGSWTKAED